MSSANKHTKSVDRIKFIKKIKKVWRIVCNTSIAYFFTNISIVKSMVIKPISVLTTNSDTFCDTFLQNLECLNFQSFLLILVIGKERNGGA